VSSGFEKRRTARSAGRRWLIAALVAVLAAGGVAAWVALAAGTPPPAPTITAKPTNPTNSTSASFTYTDTQTVTSYQCSLDGAAFADCGTTQTSTKSYSNLAAGSHTFQVRAFVKQGNLTGPATSYTWVIDTTPPTVTSVSRVGGASTNASSVQWTVNFSEPVTGVDATDFALVKSGVSGASTAVTLTGTGASYTATLASTGTGDGSIGLNLIDDDSIVDAATNKLGGTGTTGTTNGGFTGQVFTIDRTPPASAPTITAGPSGLVNSSTATFSFSSTEAGVTSFRCQIDAGPVQSCSSPASFSGLADGSRTFKVSAADAAGNVGPAATRTWTIDTVPPPAPVLGTKPDDPNGDGIANFDWTDSESPVTYKCSLENGPFVACTGGTSATSARYVVDVSNDGTHQFAVRAFDAAGNFSTTSYSWKVLHAVNVVVDGNADGLLYPAGPVRTLVLVLHNPNNFPVTINLITVTVSSSPSGCAAGPVGANPANIVLTQSNIDGSGAQTVTVPANTNLTLPAVNRPTIQLLDTGLNQQACKNGSFTFSYVAKGSK